ncbi:hypothetical protein [Paenibacillus herberti]|uniref:Serine acetyltransferase n=1 Tax=Paenibacillus herberti TaxID=1619309 RepID=A0A229NW85_9BACL|nr:hypothetical protein [Paenibacillus herberti]OXM14120.1 serine acetyltransferase [Paenibacillus herberti]
MELTMFTLSLSVDELKQYVFNQLNNFFPDKRLFMHDKLFDQSILLALDRTEFCFRHITLKSFHYDGETFFSHFHSDQYTIFLWFLSNSLLKVFNDTEIASKVFYLNKILNGVACMYDTKLPNIFLIVHGGSIVLGKANYSDFFVCYQGCTVGAIKGVYPTLERGVAMAPQSSIIGNCIVGAGSTIGNQALLRNQSLLNQSLYYRDTSTGSHMIQNTSKSWAQSFFNVPILSVEGCNNAQNNSG